jgi:pimeloyl-ACP methyl ester carboxylesterase
MADVEAVRVALGAARINLIGASYGTRAALEYQRQFPQAVRRVVLDGVAPPDMVLPAAFSVDSQAALDRVFAACEAEAACRERHPALRSRWQQLLAASPRRVTLAHPFSGRPETVDITRELLLMLVRAPLYAPALGAALPAAIAAATEGRFEPLAALGTSFAARREMQLAEGMHFAVICSEDAPRLTGVSSAASAPAQRGAAFGDLHERLYARACADWPRGAVPEAFYRIDPAPAATLVLSGGADPATPPRHGERVVAALGPRARHVVVAEAGHGLMALPCLRDVLFHFIDAADDSAALAVDAGCAARLPRPPAFAPPLAANAPRTTNGAPR